MILDLLIYCKEILKESTFVTTIHLSSPITAHPFRGTIKNEATWPQCLRRQVGVEFLKLENSFQAGGWDTRWDRETKRFHYRNQQPEFHYKAKVLIWPVCVMAALWNQSTSPLLQTVSRSQPWKSSTGEGIIWKHIAGGATNPTKRQNFGLGSLNCTNKAGYH